MTTGQGWIRRIGAAAIALALALAVAGCGLPGVGGKAAGAVDDRGAAPAAASAHQAVPSRATGGKAGDQAARRQDLLASLPPYEVVGLQLLVGYLSQQNANKIQPADGPGPLLLAAVTVAVNKETKEIPIPTFPGATWGSVTGTGAPHGAYQAPKDGYLTAPGPFTPNTYTLQIAMHRRDPNFPSTISWTSPWDVADFSVGAAPAFAGWLEVDASPSSGMLHAGQTVTIKLSLNRAWCDAHPDVCYVSPPPPPHVGKP